MMGFERNLVVLQLNDQSDGRSLIGSYVSTEVPGEFTWQPGIITQAAIHGNWIVLEDIDKVPLDIIASL